MQNRIDFREPHLSPELNNIFLEYEHFFQRTLTGEFGKTAQFYCVYLTLVGYYFILQRSIRTADYELYTYIFPKLTNLFFAFNLPNYARWTVLHEFQMVNID